jgi:chromosome segregation ATPase
MIGKTEKTCPSADEVFNAEIVRIAPPLVVLDEIAALKERVRLAEEKADELGMEAARQLERVRELEAERNLLKSDLDKVERGYDEVSQRRDETVAMCDYLQNQVKDLENILEQESRMVKAFMSELDKNQDENEFLHGRISELEAKNKRMQSELNKWTRPYDNADLQVMKEQSDSKSLAAQQAYINALDWHYRHEQAENNWLKEALENVLLAIDHEDYYNDAVFVEALKLLDRL